MSGTTRTAKASAKVAEAAVNPLDRFKDAVIARVGIVTRTKLQAILATVLLGETLAEMYDVCDDAIPAVKDDAPKSEKSARRDKVRNMVLDYVSDLTGHFYSWANVDAWVNAARVNATLPEAVRVTLDDDGNPAGVFGVWPLQYLGRVEDEAVRATLAEKLAASGQTTEDAVRAAVAEANGESAESREPVAAAAMVKALVTKVEKREAGPLATIRHIALAVPEDDVLALQDFGRIVWNMTPSDPAVEDATARKNKRLEVFRAAIEQLSFTGEAAENDGVDDATAKA